MKPSGRGPRRKDLRKMTKGVKTGRRGTHPVTTTYGRGQQRREWELHWSAVRMAAPVFPDPVTVRAAPPASVTVLITDAAGNTGALVIDPAERLTDCPDSLTETLRGRP